MDLVAEMLLEHLRHEHGEAIAPTLVRPPMPRRLTRMAARRAGQGVGDGSRSRAAVGLSAGPRRRQAAASTSITSSITRYAHLVHDAAAGRSARDVPRRRRVPIGAAAGGRARARRRSAGWRARILDGLRKAAHVPCDSEATRDALIAPGGLSRRSAVGHPERHRHRRAAGDRRAGRRRGRAAARRPAGGVELLHVGSTIAAQADRRPARRLRRGRASGAGRAADPRRRTVHGGAAGARARSRRLDAIVVLPFVDRATLAAVYRRAALALLPSEREGFGLPLVESLACGHADGGERHSGAARARRRRRGVLPARRRRAVGDRRCWRCSRERDRPPDGWRRAGRRAWRAPRTSAGRATPSVGGSTV